MEKLQNIPKTTEVVFGNGKYIFKLGALLHNKGISLNKFMEEIGSEYKVMEKYIYGNLRYKLDMVIIAKICDYFECGISDVVEYIPLKKEI